MGAINPERSGDDVGPEFTRVERDVDESEIITRGSFDTVESEEEARAREAREDLADDDSGPYRSTGADGENVPAQEPARRTDFGQEPVDDPERSGEDRFDAG